MGGCLARGAGREQTERALIGKGARRPCANCPRNALSVRKNLLTHQHLRDVTRNGLFAR